MMKKVKLNPAFLMRKMKVSKIKIYINIIIIMKKKMAQIMKIKN